MKQTRIKILSEFDRKAFFKAVLTAFFVLGVLACVAYVDFYGSIVRTVPLFENVETEEGAVTTIGPGEEYRQPFYAYTSFYEMKLVLASDRVPQKVSLILQNGEGENVASTVIANENLETDQEYGGSLLCTFPVSKEGQWAEEGSYTLVIQNGSDREVSVSLKKQARTGALQADENGYALNLSAYTETRLGRYLFLAVFGLLFVYAALVFYYIRTGRFSWISFFLLSAFVLGGIYLLLMPAWSTNDAQAHFVMAYRYSNFLSGQPAGNFNARPEDAVFFNQVWIQPDYPWAPNPSLQTLLPAWKGNWSAGLSNAASGSLGSGYEYMLFYKILSYLPLSIGLAAGRILGLSPLACILLGRISAGIIYSLLIAHAIRRTPVGKGVLAMLALVPTSLMALTAYCYDNAVIAVSFNVIAGVLALAEKNTEKDVLTESGLTEGGIAAGGQPEKILADGRRIEMRLVLETLVWCFLLGGIKGGGYLLIFPVFTMLLSRPLRQKRNLVPLAMIGTGIFSAFFWDYLLQDHSRTFFQLGTDAGSAYAASYALYHPFGYFLMWVRTMIRNLDSFFFGAFGLQIGFNERFLPYILIACLIVLMIGSVFLDEKRMNGRKNILSLALGAFLVLFLTPVMLLKDTPKGWNEIALVQGRYFLPVLPLLLLILPALADKLLHGGGKGSAEQMGADDAMLKKKKNGLLMESFAVTSCMIVYFMLRTYLTR